MPRQRQPQFGAALGGLLDQLLGLDHLERGDAGRHRQIVLREGRAVHDGAIHAVEHLVEDAFARQHRADRHVAAGQRLRQQHHVGLDIPVLDREESSGAADPGLDLVGDEQRAVLPAERGGARQKFVGRHVDALALDRLDDEGGDLARRQRLLERCEVVERDCGASRQQRLETAAEIRVVRQRQRAVGQAVKGVVAVDDARASGRAARELDRGLDRFGAGIGEKHLVQIWHMLQQTLGQYAGERRDVELHEIGQVGVEHALQRLAQRRMVAANRKNAKTAQ